MLASFWEGFDAPVGFGPTFFRQYGPIAVTAPIFDEEGARALLTVQVNYAN
jgi:hypothetical protein